MIEEYMSNLKGRAAQAPGHRAIRQAIEQFFYRFNKFDTGDGQSLRPSRIESIY
jgi:hypothetical protein